MTPERMNLSDHFAENFPVVYEHIRKTETKVAELEARITELNNAVDFRDRRINEHFARKVEQADIIKRMTAFLEAFVVAYKEPVEGPWFKLRAFAESQGIYADDLGRDRILLRIAQAALNGPVSK